LLPAAVLLFCAWAASQSGTNEWLTFVGFVVTGTILFAIARRAVRHG
jgi:hypothetical protein